MGRDKAFLELDGRTLLERALELARGMTEHVKIVGAGEKYAAYAPVVEDLYPGQGPLAGIHAALKSSTSELNLMIGVDTPFLKPRLLHYLVEEAEKSGAVVTVPVTSFPFRVSSFQSSATDFMVGTRPADAVTRNQALESPSPDQPITRSPEADDSRSSLKIRGWLSGGQAQPLCAVYRREFAAVAEEALRQRRNNIVPLFAKVTRREIDDSELRKMAFDPIMFDNLNTPEEWQQACKRTPK